MSTLKLCDTLYVFCQRGICFGMYFYMLGGEIYLKRTKIPFVAQLGSMDCGAACLAMLFNYYGCKVDIVDISTYIHIGRDGMSLSIMKETAEKYGFRFSAYQYSYEQKNLDSMLPVILCNDSHYMVLEYK